MNLLNRSKKGQGQKEGDDVKPKLIKPLREKTAVISPSDLQRGTQNNTVRHVSSQCSAVTDHCSGQLLRL